MAVVRFPALVVILTLVVACSDGPTPSVRDLDPVWVEAHIAEALTAAPSVVTRDARIFAWREDGSRVLIREGDGPYTCVASGSYSLRLQQPALAHPDPLCADQNAWAFFEAIWAEDDPLAPSETLPSAPGLVWMLRGMNISGGQVRYGRAEDGQLHVGGEPEAGSESDAVVNMTPHVMIWPLRIDPHVAQLPEVYDVLAPPAQWVMAGGTTVAHMHVHFSEATYAALAAIPPPDSDR